MWKQKLGHKATYTCLICAFKAAGHHDYADNVKEIGCKLSKHCFYVVHVDDCCWNEIKSKAINGGMVRWICSFML